MQSRAPRPALLTPAQKYIVRRPVFLCPAPLQNGVFLLAHRRTTMPFALLALTLSAFAIGTTEFVIVGLIPTIATSLGVSVPSAGLLVSLYALGVAIGAPVLTALTGCIPRKQLLLGLMTLFTI